MQDFQKIGMAYSALLANNPIFKAYETVGCWWYDQWVTGLLKVYYWPAFVAGISDNVQDLFNPKTYSICKI